MILAIEHMWIEILDDMVNGDVDSGVRTFSDLHDTVDANEYGARFHDGNTEIANLMQAIISDRLRQRQHWRAGDPAPERARNAAEQMVARWERGGNVMLTR
jgi:hypothetical protein